MQNIVLFTFFRLFLFFLSFTPSSFWKFVNKTIFYFAKYKRKVFCFLLSTLLLFWFGFVVIVFVFLFFANFYNPTTYQNKKHPSFFCVVLRKKSQKLSSYDVYPFSLFKRPEKLRNFQFFHNFSTADDFSEKDFLLDTKFVPSNSPWKQIKRTSRTNATEVCKKSLRSANFHHPRNLYKMRPSMSTFEKLMSFCSIISWRCLYI